MSRSICGVCLCPYWDSGECACEIKGNGMNNYAQATQEVRDAFNSLCRGRIEAAVKAEREACAKMFELYWNDDGLQRTYSPTEYINTVRPSKEQQ